MAGVMNSMTALRLMQHSKIDENMGKHNIHRLILCIWSDNCWPKTIIKQTGIYFPKSTQGVLLKQQNGKD